MALKGSPQTLTLSSLEQRGLDEVSIECLFLYRRVFMPNNNGPSVAGLCIASAAPTNISTVKLKCSQSAPNFQGTDRPFKTIQKKDNTELVTPPCAISGRN